jgi:basic membrane protein A
MMFAGAKPRVSAIGLLCAAALVLTASLPARAVDQPPKVAAVFGTPVEEPWVQQIHSALLRASEESDIHYQWSDQVKPDALEATLRGYAEQGSDLIVADSFAAEELARRVAKDFPTTSFLLGSGGGPAAPNVSVFDNWLHEPAYLAGLLAGGLTKSGRVGVVAAMPIAEVNRLANAFCHGAREANPVVDCQTSFIGSFYDPKGAEAAAKAQIDAGADVIFAERMGAIDGAAERGVAAIGHLADQASLAPDSVVTSVIWDWAPTLAYVLAEVETGTLASDDLGRFSLMRHGGAELAPYGRWVDRLPEDLKQLVDSRRQEILDGTFRVLIDESAPRSD